MISFILAEQNTPFAVALALMFFIAALEGVTTMLGVGVSGFLDSLLPDMDIDVDIDVDMDVDVDVDVDADLGAPDVGGGHLIAMLSWLRIGQVPVLVLLIIFLTSFGLFGIFMQMAVQQMTGRLLPALPASGAAFVLALPMVRLFGGILARIIPKDETEAVSENSMIGLVAVVSMGRARTGSPAQSKLADRFGQSHYVMVEPDDPNEEFVQGDEVLLVSRHGATFIGIRNTSPALGRNVHDRNQTGE